MRLRNIPGAEEEVAKSPYCITTPQEYRGHWAGVFKDDYLERLTCQVQEGFIAVRFGGIFARQ